MPPAKTFSKSKLSMYLRTGCDRELYLSLHKESELRAHGLPVPLPARPGIGALQKAGTAFETEQNAQLRTAFPGRVVENGHGGVTTDDLTALLGLATATPSVVLQARFQPQTFRTQVLTNLSVDASAQALIPPMDGLIPDVLLVTAPVIGEEIVRPDGGLGVLPAGETRRVLRVIDIKHAAEANASYSAEVVLYTFMLANFLVHAGLDGQFVVSADPRLWTRSSVGRSKLRELVDNTPAVSLPGQADALVAALREDCDAVPFRFYIQTVRRFFRESLPRVIAAGDANWQALDWHVDSRCSSCDWLGYGRWLGGPSALAVAANPSHYCVPNAELVDHLSRIVGITRGARRVLSQHAVTTAAAVAGHTGQEVPYGKHSVLKRERARLPARASALPTPSVATGHVTPDPGATIATLARSVHLQISVAVNFDAGAGLLTGLALTGRVGFPYRPAAPAAPVALGSDRFVVEGKSADKEWAALEGFLSRFAETVSRAEAEFVAQGFTKPDGKAMTIHAQVAFWEKRQYEELCAALGRHLPRVWKLAAARERALAWLFPPDELLERADGAISPCVVFVEDIVKRAVSLPTAHALTLFGTAEHYYYGIKVPWIPDAYYREYLSNGIPRERIYEIWSGADPIRRGKGPSEKVFPRGNLIASFLDAMKAQAVVLDNVTLRLRTDFKNQLRGRAASLSTAIPRGANGVAFDGKLWLWWDQLEVATQKIEDHVRLAESGSTLEAAYEAIRLTRRVATLPNGDRVYEVSPDSAEAKIEDGTGFLAIGMDGTPGFPLTSVQQHLANPAPAYTGDPKSLTMPFWSAVKATLVSFDRARLEAVVRFDARDPDLLPYLAAATTIDLDQDIFLTPGKTSYDPSEITRAVLETIGNPPIARPDPRAAAAMGQKAKHPGADPITPAAEVLWDAAALRSCAVRTPAASAAIAQCAHALHKLNPSQRQSVVDAAQSALSVIWGPPGTGKTNTLVAHTHALIREAVAAGRGANILISGPTYKAVEELLTRLVDALAKDPIATAEVYAGYSRSRTPVPLASSAAHVHAASFAIAEGDPDWAACQASLSNATRVTVFATTVHQVHKAAQALHGSVAGEVFDVVILDESSQIPVTRALGALAARKPTGQLIVAGDHLQMPPIFSLEPPTDAAYLIGSIQTYLLSRDFGAPLQASELLENYRSAEQLVAFARTIGYPAGLTAAHPATALRLLAPIAGLRPSLPAGLPWSDAWAAALDPARPVVTLLHDDDLSSQSNDFEAKMVAALAYCLRNAASGALDGRGSATHAAPSPASFWSTSLGIVTPHRAQRAAVIRALRETFPHDDPASIAAAVDTVEKFQGGQRHTVIVSFGVGDPDVIAGEEAFLMQLERTNVAISRAMAKCIVLMPRTLAAHVPEEKKALETAHALKGYIDEFCDTAADVVIDPAGEKRTGQLRWRS